jgi:hydroxypyruvate reductase
LSQVKGGGLSRLAFPSQTVTLILSDVIGDPLDVIASGPTVPDPTTFEDALKIVEKLKIRKELPASILDHLIAGKRGHIPETPKSGDQCFIKTQNVVIGNNYQAAQGAIKQAKALGFNTLLLTTFLSGEAREAGRFLASIARQIERSGDPVALPACIIAGGETTVTIKGNGKGGRNQELALASVEELAGLDNIILITLATDGEDGPTEAAGAVVTGKTLNQARQIGLNPTEYLQQNDSHSFFNHLEDLLQPGPTGTNVCDLALIVAL